HTRSKRDWSSDVCSSDLLEQAPSLFRVRAVEPNDERVLRHVETAERVEDAARDLVAARDAAEDVEEDRLHLRVARDHLEGVDHRSEERRVGKECRSGGSV